MRWTASTSPSFLARHDAALSEEAATLLQGLELTRERLTAYFPRPLEGMTVVIHDSASSLWLARPQMALGWAATAPAARRYLAGCGGSKELHVLSSEVLARRASAVPGSREMLALAAPALYARAAILANNGDLQRVPRAARPALVLRWAWLIEGAARWFCGQNEHARPAIARRLREGARPSFPPSMRDAPLLGGTVIDLVAREQGQLAAARLACRLHPGGPRGALSRAFGGRSLVHSEGAWRSHLARLASGS
jgi:hypothetical protein